MRVSWRDAYGEAAGRLTAQAVKARPVFTGHNACVDAIFHIDAERLARLAASPIGGSADDRTGAGLLARIMDRITRGRGGELLTRWPAGPPWLTGLLGPPDRHQVGGTGPQASWALAVAGARSVLALQDRSAEQLAVIDPRVGICVDGAIVPAGSVTPSGSPTKLPHCILEFTTGTSHAGVTVPRSSRIILRFGDEPIECDEQFLAMTKALTPVAAAGLLSGLNTLADDELTERAWLASLARAWSDGGLPVIHHELAEFPAPERLREAVAMGLLGDGWQATSVPAPYLPRPAGTVGLGDTFVAGILLAESIQLTRENEE